MTLLRSLTVITAIATSPAWAQTPVTYVDAGAPLFTVEVPDFWTVRTGGLRDITDTSVGETRGVDRVIGLRPEDDDGAWMGFVAPDGVGTMAQGRTYLQEITRFLASDPVVTGRSNTRIGGRPAEVIRASGRRDGRAIGITATLIDLPGARVAVGIAVLAADADAGFVAEMNDVFASFRAAR